ncbi:MAG: ABC transporter permease [Nitrospirota bacterium]
MRQLLKKELLHILRDKGLVIFILYAFTLDIYISAHGFALIPERVSISVYDEDNSPESRELIGRIEPPMFRKPGVVLDRHEIDRLLNESKTVLALIIPSDFQKDLYRDKASLQVLVDGTQSAAAYLSSAYLNFIIEQYSADLMKERLKFVEITGLPSIDLRSRIYFNPDANDRLFEGINEFFMVITLIGMILPAAVLIREKEYGTIEQILISPLNIRKLILMKIIAASAFLLAMIASSYELVLKVWLDFPLKGTVYEFILLSFVYSIATTGLSFIIASVAKRLSQIGMLTIVIFAPMLLLSGGWVPPEAFPDWLRKLTFFSPLKYFMDLGIGLLIRGAHIELLLPNLIRLFILGFILMGAGYMLYDRRILKVE